MNVDRKKAAEQLCVIVEKVRTQRGRVNKANLVIVNAMMELRERIKAGESTGNRALDFAILLRGSTKPKDGRSFAELEKLFVANANGVALFITEESMPTVMHIVDTGQSGMMTVERYFVGRIKPLGDPLYAISSYCTGFPVSEYVELSGDVAKLKVMTQDDGFGDKSGALGRLGGSDRSPAAFFAASGLNKWVFVGQQAVEAKINLDLLVINAKELYAQALLLLGFPGFAGEVQGQLLG